MGYNFLKAVEARLIRDREIRMRDLDPATEPGMAKLSQQLGRPKKGKVWESTAISAPQPGPRTVTPPPAPPVVIPPTPPPEPPRPEGWLTPAELIERATELRRNKYGYRRIGELCGISTEAAKRLTQNIPAPPRGPYKKRQRSTDVPPKKEEK
jgi:hypothetical protein